MIGQNFMQGFLLAQMQEVFVQGKIFVVVMNSSFLYFCFISLFSLGNCSTASQDHLSQLKSVDLSTSRVNLLKLETGNEWLDDCLYELRSKDIWTQILNIKAVAQSAHDEAIKSLIQLFDFSKFLTVKKSALPVVEEVEKLVLFTKDALNSEQKSTKIVVAVVVNFLLQMKALEADSAKNALSTAIIPTVTIMNELRMIFCKFLEQSFPNLSTAIQKELAPLKEMMCLRPDPACSEGLRIVSDADVKALLGKLKGKSLQLDACIDELLKDNVWNTVLSLKDMFPVNHKAAFESIFDILDSNKHCDFLKPNEETTPKLKQTIFKKKKILNQIKDDALLLAKIVLQNIEQEYSLKENQKVLNATFIKNNNDTDYVEMHKIFANLLDTVYPKLPPADRAVLKSLKDNLCFSLPSATKTAPPTITGPTVVFQTTGATGTTDTTANTGASDTAKKFQRIIDDTKKSPTTPLKTLVTPTNTSTSTSTHTTTNTFTPTKTATNPPQTINQSQSTSNQMSKSQIQQTNPPVSNNTQTVTNSSKNKPVPNQSNSTELKEQESIPNSSSTIKSEKRPNKSTKSATNPNSIDETTDITQPDEFSEQITDQDGKKPTSNRAADATAETVDEQKSHEIEMKKDLDAQSSETQESNNNTFKVIIAVVVIGGGLIIVAVYFVIKSQRR